ncbi:hypothetical protein JOB18_001097 [Solea senegalensis]|uniref:Uncharacterized protein n=1 Tax=Solea senegalensis TaxID=28829 RepID=A0AAV6RRD0_SOLSE|nr:hypothetical protein JOB18_001097 [Solea senegalensis]
MDSDGISEAFTFTFNSTTTTEAGFCSDVFMVHQHVLTGTSVLKSRLTEDLNSTVYYPADMLSGHRQTAGSHNFIYLTLSEREKRKRRESQEMNYSAKWRESSIADDRIHSDWR